MLAAELRNRHLNTGLCASFIDLTLELVHLIKGILVDNAVYKDKSLRTTAINMCVLSVASGWFGLTRPSTMYSSRKVRYSSCGHHCLA